MLTLEQKSLAAYALRTVASVATHDVASLDYYIVEETPQSIKDYIAERREFSRKCEEAAAAIMQL